MKDQPKILVVDDSEFSRRVIMKALSNAGYSDIIEAGNGTEALRLYKKSNPDLILLDLIMPETDGLSFLEELGKQDASVKVVVVTVISGKVMEDEVRALYENVIEYITKPVKDEEVVEAVKRAVSV